MAYEVELISHVKLGESILCRLKMGKLKFLDFVFKDDRYELISHRGYTKLQAHEKLGELMKDELLQRRIRKMHLKYMQTIRK